MTSVTRLDHAYTLELVSSPYLESGWMQHGAYAPAAPAAYVPSNLAYGAEQAGGAAQGFVSFVDGAVAGAEALPARPSNAVANRFLPPALHRDSLNGFHSADAVYANDAGLPDAKKCQRAVSPSRFTGLLQVLVQAAFGSAPRRYALDEGSGGLAVDGAGLRHTGTGSHWVACFAQARPPGSTEGNTAHGSRAPLAADGAEGGFWEDTASKLWYGPKAYGAWGGGYRLGREYWLAGVEGGRATFRYIETARAACDNAGTGLAARQAHAVLLGGSKITQRALSFKVEPVKGDPLAYGWKSNADGSEVRIVCHEDKGGHWQAAYYSLTVTADATGSPAAVRLSTLGEGAWNLSAGTHCLWVPNLVEMRQESLKGKGGSRDCHAPLYVVSRGGAFDLVSVTGSGSAGAAAGFTGGGLAAMGRNATAPSDHLEELVTRGAETDAGLAFDDWTSAELTGQNYGPAVEDTRTHTGGRYEPWYPKRVDRADHAEYTLDWTSWTSRVDYAKALLLIPFDDCDALVGGTLTGSDWASRYHEVKNKTIDVKFYFSFQDWSAYASGDPAPLWQDNGYLAYDPPSAYNGHLDAWFWPWVTATVSELANDGHEAPVMQVSVSLKSSIAAVAGPSDAYFNPQMGPAGDPFINASNVYEPTGPGYRYSLSQGESGASDWPGGNPVGWA